ncbi:hypothetical protein P171DRAFT_495209 [Karstenula rhodostoma CBS 690.94]|uniref:Rhodopsin domain-containing protein n=1 Tax=Karstenula rhodostoma CBS 690.94 TaxID=1392251 RepID=A0A9P4PGA9_9PLEO|nr:hypothetical protein P171DRAFT_495209 [Karstenula rhodostoma CBS 690.94]
MHVGVRQALHTQPVSIQALTYSREHSYLAIAATLVSFALLIFSLRVYTRTRLLRFFAIDDWLILGAAMGSVVALASLVHIDVSDQRESFTNGDSQTESPFLWIFDIFFIISITATKTSATCLLLRTVKRTSYRRFLYIIAAIVASAGLAWFATVLFQCVPVGAAWEPERRVDARCIQYDAFNNVIVFYNAINAATSLVFAVLPMCTFLCSHHAIRNKLFLIPRITVTSLGLISTVAAIIRLVKVYNLRNTTFPFTHAATICICSVVEMTSSMTAACLPTLKPLLATVSDFFSSLSPTRRSSSAKPPHHHHHPDADSPPPSPYPQSYSTPTFLSLPRPKPARFHDHTSDLDFDLFEAPSTMRSRAHSRTPSNLTMFTSFTNFTSTFTVPPFDREFEAGWPRAHSKATSEVERSVELVVGGARGGYAVSVTSGETCEESEEEKTIRRIGSEESCGGGVVGGDHADDGGKG